MIRYLSVPVSSESGWHLGISVNLEWRERLPKSPRHSHKTDFRRVLGVLFVLFVLCVL